MNAPAIHIDLETQAAFVEGALDDGSRMEVMRHLSRCARCRVIVEQAAAIDEEDDERTAWSSWAKVAMAAGILLALATLAVMVRETWPTGRQDPIARMASAAPASARTIEPRISGFHWAPYRNLMADAPKKSADQLAAGSVAGQVLKELKNDESARALHARGIAHLLRGEMATAVPLLRRAAALGRANAKVWNDLSAALYVNAPTDADLREALKAARTAIRLDHGLTEAYFNVALILERIGAPKAEIKAAWTEYLRRDAHGGWADEAKDRLAQIQEGN